MVCERCNGSGYILPDSLDSEEVEYLQKMAAKLVEEL
jgi:hypothetical protein